MIVYNFGITSRPSLLPEASEHPVAGQNELGRAFLLPAAAI